MKSDLGSLCIVWELRLACIIGKVNLFCFLGCLGFCFVFFDQAILLKHRRVKWRVSHRFRVHIRSGLVLEDDVVARCDGIIPPFLLTLYIRCCPTLEKVLRKRSGKAERNGFYLIPTVGWIAPCLTRAGLEWFSLNPSFGWTGSAENCSIIFRVCGAKVVAPSWISKLSRYFSL